MRLASGEPPSNPSVFAVEHAAREEAARACFTEKQAVTVGEWWKLLEWKVRANSRTRLLCNLRHCDGEAHDSE